MEWKIPKTGCLVYSEAITTIRAEPMESQDHEACIGVIYKKFLWYEKFQHDTMYT